jgi:hypothetical protein
MAVQTISTATGQSPPSGARTLSALGGAGWSGTPAPPAPPAETDEERRKRTGVDPGGQGYVSGQAPPGSAPAAPAAASAPAAPPPAATIGTSPRLSTSGGTAPPATAGAPGSTGASPTGTVQGPSALGPLPGYLNTIPGIGPALGGIVGGLTSPTGVDLRGVQAAQNANFGEAAALGGERSAYRPGAAPSQNGVTIDTGQSGQTRDQQEQQLAALTAAANGTAPSAAELQGRAQAGRDAASVLGAARALGGRSAGGVARAATLGESDILARSNANAATQRAAEQATARGELSNTLSALRGQDIGQATNQAGLTQQQYGNNLNAQLQTNAQTEEHRKALLQAQLQAMGYGTTAATGGVSAAATNAAGQNQMKGNLISGIANAIGL